MTWEIMIMAYLLIGVCLNWMASIGHKPLYGIPLPWYSWVAGIVAWPIILIIGGMKK